MAIEIEGLKKLRFTQRFKQRGQLRAILFEKPERNPYTFRFYRRFEGLIFWLLKGKRIYWSSEGHLCHGHVEIKHLW